ncbi:hypothetical protein [Flavobacterium sp. N1994]|uniref:hypothetical protein n=1 Tax=Flavobacterium sp. N1994 TaxID=2986827 RepID=UPI0022214FED|nr:hypothetical protein [Flavobacterium sp. N1994]
MSNIIDFSQLGGYRLEQPTFDKMQSTYFGILDALMGHLRVPNSGKFIVSGCEFAAGNIAPGIMYIDGVLCPFAGTTTGTETTGTKIKKNVTTGSLSFENGTNPVVFTVTNAIVDATGTALSAFTRIPYNDVVPWSTLIDVPADLVHDAGYVHTDENFTAALLAKLNGIAANAEVNVQVDWLETDITSDAYIKNKPLGLLLTYLKQGTYVHGDLITSEQLVTISFADIGTANYKVVGALEGSGSAWTADSAVIWGIRNKTSTSFQLSLQDRGNFSGQALTFDYILIPKNNN